MKKQLALTSVVIVLVLSHTIQAQGCSDAGVCTAGSLGHGPSEHAQWSFGLQYGLGEQGIVYVDAELAAVLPFGLNNRIDVRLPFRSISGDLDQVFGLSDVSATWIRDFRLSDMKLLSANLGLRIPTGEANRSLDSGDPLPMPYQTSLGTVDLILGLSYRPGLWIFGAGYQQPLNSNRNGYVQGLDSLSEKPFPSTRNFNRRGDVVVRMGRQFGEDREPWVFSASALGIVHLGQDQYEDADGQMRSIEGSEGLTFNLTGSVRRNWESGHSLGLDMGFPLVVREVRPDGLTRSFVLGLKWRSSF
jgi:hypothetical protein